MKFTATGIAILALLGLASAFFFASTHESIFILISAGSFTGLGLGLFFGFSGRFDWKL